MISRGEIEIQIKGKEDQKRGQLSSIKMYKRCVLGKFKKKGEQSFLRWRHDLTSAETHTHWRRDEGMMSGEIVRKKQMLYILPIPLGPASSLLIASHIKVSSPIFSTADIVISPAEVIHLQCNITLPLSVFFISSSFLSPWWLSGLFSLILSLSQLSQPSTLSFSFFSLISITSSIFS